MIQPVSADFRNFRSLGTKPVVEVNSKLSKIAAKEELALKAPQLRVRIGVRFVGECGRFYTHSLRGIAPRRWSTYTTTCAVCSELRCLSLQPHSSEAHRLHSLHCRFATLSVCTKSNKFIRLNFSKPKAEVERGRSRESEGDGECFNPRLPTL